MWCLLHSRAWRSQAESLLKVTPNPWFTRMKMMLRLMNGLNNNRFKPPQRENKNVWSSFNLSIGTWPCLPFHQTEQGQSSFWSVLTDRSVCWLVEPMVFNPPCQVVLPHSIRWIDQLDIVVAVLTFNQVNRCEDLSSTNFPLAIINWSTSTLTKISTRKFVTSAMEFLCCQG